MATITLNRHELAVALHIGPVAALHGDDTGHPIYLEVLHRGVERGLPVVGLEPSCTAALRHDLPRLLDTAGSILDAAVERAK
mgnify:CR=1 FL=1